MLKLLKENVPWIAPTVAIVLFGTGFFDQFNKSQAPQTAIPTAALPETVVAPTPAVVETVAVVETPPAAAFVEPEPAPVVLAVANPDPSTAARLAALVEAAAEPEVTRGEAITTQINGIGDDPAAFFANAQANLAAASNCENDLAALANDARIYFPSGGLAGADAGLAQARLIGQVLKGCPGFMVQVEGHSDPSGDSQINLRLSQRRAESVVARLAASGIDTRNFVAKGFGDVSPSGVTGIESAAYYDRRVEFSIIKLDTPNGAVIAGNQWQQPGCVADLQANIDQTRLFYGPGSITVPSDDMESVYKLAAEAAQCDGARLRVVGNHSDNPSAREGAATGRLRALAIMNTLVATGFAADQIIVGAPSWSRGIPGQPGLPNSRVDFELVLSEI